MPPTVTVTLALAFSAPSLMVYVNVSVPRNPASGVYVTVWPSVVTVPLVAPDASVTVSASPSGSESFARTAISTAVPGLAEAESACARGASLTGVTVTVTVAELVPPLPSLAVYVKLSVPLESGAGVYVTVVPSVAAVPLAGCVRPVTARSSPSGSESLTSTGISTAVSSGVVAASFCARGASLTGVTVTVTVAVSVPPLPSATVYAKLSVPLKSASGV